MKDEVAAFKRETILEVAVAEFYRRGYDGTRVDTIASNLGVTKPFIYYHFANKTEILDEICIRVTASSVERLTKVLAEVTDTATLLRRAMQDLIHGVIGQQAWIAIYFREESYISDKARAVIEANRREFDGLMNGLLERARDEGLIDIPDRHVATQALTGMITWAFTWYRPEGRLKPEEATERLVELGLNMLRVRSAPALDD